MDHKHGEVGSVYEECVSGIMNLRRSNTDLCYSVEDLADMTSIGLGLPRNTFREAGKYG
jgi:hypothetical protein